ncbi:MAG: hypothetical protein GY847_41700 [Proteobacteria bacterium]|nr:hypothetical protein [Pseudomonadota bacterium]
MNTENKNRSKQPANETTKEEDALPPLDHDEIEEADPEELASFLTTTDEEGALLLYDEEQPFDDKFNAADSVISPIESSWMEDSGEPAGIEIDTEIEEEQQKWTEGDDVEAVNLEKNWFIDDDEKEVLPEDDGAEEPIEEETPELDVDRKLWDDLEDEKAFSEEEEEILDAMERLGIDLPDYELDAVAEVSPALLLDKQFLGPKEGDVTAAAFSGGSPIAVGDGLFVLGADSMLHPVVGSQGLMATSISVCGETIFFGTESRGALFTKDRAQSLTQINSWYTHDLIHDERASFKGISSQFEIFGQELSSGYRLIGRTGSGQIFTSLDNGHSWQGPLIQGHCLAICPVCGREELVAMVDSASQGVCLHRNKDHDVWERLNFPDIIAQAASKNRISLSAVAETVVVAVDDPSIPMYCSLDDGQTWLSVEGLKGVTAVALDPDDPGWIAAATYNPVQNLGVVRLSDDGGQNWRVALTIESPNEDDELASTQNTQNECRILDLVVHTGRMRQVLAATSRGVHLITLARPGVSH